MFGVIEFTLNAVASDFVAGKLKEYAAAHDWLESGTDSLLWLIQHPVSGMAFIAAGIVAVSSVAAFVHVYRNPGHDESLPGPAALSSDRFPKARTAVQFLPLDKRSVAELGNTVCLLLPVRNCGQSALENIVVHLSYQPLVAGLPQSLEIDRGLWVERDSYAMFLQFGETARLVVAAFTPRGCLAPSIPSVPSPSTDLRRSLGISSWSCESYPTYQLADANYRVNVLVRGEGFSCTVAVLMTVENQTVAKYRLQQAFEKAAQNRS